MALYEVVVRQLFQGQNCINVFDYYSPPGIGFTPTALELLSLMGFIPTGDPLAFPEDTVAAAMQGLQNTAVQFLSAEARELYSLTDFYEAVYTPPLIGGNAGGTPMTPFAAFGFYSARIRLDIRRSFKRFTGVGEGDVTNGGEVTGGTVGAMTELATRLSEALEGSSAAYLPCTISREKIPATEDDPVKYVLYPDPAEQEEHTAYPLVWSAYAYIRSQTSRQYGRGI